MDEYLEYYDIESEDDIMVGGKLLDNGSYGCVYYPSLNCKTGKENKKMKHISKVQKENNVSKNEYKIGKKIRSIYGYTKRFAPIIDKCDIKIGLLDNNKLDKCKIVESGDKLVMMKTNFIKGMLLDKYMKYHNIQNKKSKYIEYYKYLLESIELLNNKNIVHHDLKGNNIIIDEVNDVPIIIDFGLSIDKLNKDSVLRVVSYSPKYILYSPELHLLGYIYKKNNNPDKDQLVNIALKLYEEIDDVILSKNYNNTIRDAYKQNIILEMLKYQNMSKDKVYTKIMNVSDTFDLYSLNIMFLKLLKYVFTENNDYLLELKKILLLGIHPNIDKRLSIKETKSLINGLDIL